MAYSSVTRSTLRARLQDRYDQVPFWTTTDANDALNEALRQFNLYTGYWRGTATAVTVAGTPFLTIPSSLTYRTRVTRSGLALTRKSIVEFYRRRPTWRTETTTSGGDVPTTIREWAPVGLTGVAIWPIDAAGGTTLTFEAVKLTPILTGDGDFVDIGDEELALVLDEALWVVSFKRPSIQDALEPRHKLFLEGCLERNDQLRASSYFRRMLGLDQQARTEPIRQSQDEETP